MATAFDVSAKLTLFTGNASQRLARLSNNLRAVSQGAKSADGYMARFAKRAFVLGGAYVGFHAIHNAMKGIVHSAFEFEKEMQQTRIGLKTMVSNIENISFGQAGAQVEAIWDKLTDISVRTIATTKEIHEVFAGIYGPLRSAGAAMGTIYKATRNTVYAASALGVDIPQATRDIMLMATGRAQAQVKLFTRLRATGFLNDAKGMAITAEAWNKMASPKRVKMLTDALAKFKNAGKEAEESISGRVSTFKDMVEQLSNAFFAPIFSKLADRIGVLNDWLLKNKDYLKGMLTMYGTRVAEAMDKYGKKIVDTIMRIGDNLPRLTQELGNYATRLSGYVDTALKIAKAFATISVIKTAATWFAGLASTLAHVAAIFAEGGFAGLAGAGSTALGLSLGPLAAAIGAVGVVAYAASENMYWVQKIWVNMRPGLVLFGDALMRLSKSLWRVLDPLLKMVGSAAFSVLGGAMIILSDILGSLSYAVEGISILFEDLGTSLGHVRDIASTVVGFLTEQAYKLNLITRPNLEKDIIRGANEFSATSRGFGGMVTAPGLSIMPKATADLTQKPQNNYDFRGSKITLKQEFRQADPDRIAIQMMKDIAKFSEQRVTSGFAGALTG